MAGIVGLTSRIKRCEKALFILQRKPKSSFVYMDKDGNYLWDDDVEYNDEGVLALPLPMTLDEWEFRNIHS